ncbi:MAG: Brix domain-containing protein [Candidatus Odinarchaeum yellowstonii]|uniref:Brix domain-containing protein n=1 Tax=Odinarchaeota yellowstonii (strain LCB_4) TaxID=1841599 RepID=A0AAF0IAJ9_ODILC|nr:MAG: Brix domain-containing protein [Candidatus Odinarchaeum yellowstonii]
MSLITTSRHPSVKARILIRDLSHVLPCCVRINRGKANLLTLIAQTIQSGKHTLIIVDSKRSTPSSINIIRIHDNTTILNKSVLVISDFEEKKSISNLRVPEKTSHYYIIDRETPAELTEKISRILEDLEVKRISVEELENINGIIFYLKWEGNAVILKFYLAPSMSELGPRIKIKDVF